MVSGFKKILVAFLAILPGLILPGTGFSCPCNETGKHSGTGSETGAIALLSRQLGTVQGEERIKLLVQRGEAYRSIGQFGNAEADFQLALSAATTDHHPILQNLSTQSLGYIHFLKGNPESAETLLRSALEQAEALNNPRLVANCANRLGGVLFSRQMEKEAVMLYRHALEAVSRAPDAGLEAAICRNMAAAMTDKEPALEMLAASRKAANKVECREERIELMIGIAAEARYWRDLVDVPLQHFIHDLLREAYLTSMDTNQSEPSGSRLQSLASGELGAIYEEQGRLDEAYGLTAEALSAGQRANAPELLLRWEWQLGRLMKAKGERAEAIAAYRRAVHYIESVRQDLPIRYQSGQSSFRETLAPIYFDLADLLLIQYGLVSDDNTRQSLLREARDTMERIKRSELQDYFRDRCIASFSRPITSLSEKTAVLYPIVLANRLELLLDISGRLHLKTVKVNRTHLETTAVRFSHRLRNNAFYERPAELLYSWLIEPIVELLERHHVNTIVFAPDGALRLIPIAALHGKGQFLAERYATVTTPGLTLLDPAPLPRGEINALLAGISEPGPVVLELPNSLWDAYRPPVDKAISDQPEIPAKTAEPVPSRRGADTLLLRNADADHVKQALALPGVALEIRELSKIFKGQVVLNQDFQLDRFRAEVKKNPFSVVHIASHGYFGGSPDQNFIMTYDKLLSMGTLETMIREKQFAERPLEIIALSACQTAEGDDRSPLGLTGMALKSGARSALGSLWPVSDAAAQVLFPSFYRQLRNPSVSKAEALRLAQCELLRREEFRHPFFWSPFILVGNWL